MAGPEAVARRYGKLRLLGEGGSGRVWLVRDRFLSGREIALKELSESEAALSSSLRREFATLRTLRHPNLAEVYEFGFGQGRRPFFTLEFVDGQDLVSAVRAEGPQLLVDLLAEGLRALAFLHDFELIHRDLKPANLLVRRRAAADSRLVVLDFGLALRGRDEAARAPASGTLPYLAPEILGGSPPNRRSDLWSLAAVAYEAVHGHPPRRSGLTDRSGSPPSPSGAPLRNTPEPLLRWIDGLLEEDPERRPANAGEAMARLNAACGTNHKPETKRTRAARLASGPPPGRERELQQLLELLRQTSGPRVVLITGDAGTGKTRVLRWLSAQAIREGHEIDSSTIRALTTGDLNVDRAIVESRDFPNPVWLLADELEHSVPSVEEFVDRIARDPDAPPIRIVAALRPREARGPRIRAMLEDSAWVPSIAKIDLGRLARAGIRQAVERATGRSASEAHVDWLNEVSEGSPLLVEALLTDATWEQGRRDRKVTTLEASVGERLRSISPATERWITGVVISSADVSAEAAAGVTEVDPGDLAEAVGESQMAGLVISKPGGFAPASRIVSQVVLANLSPEDRRRLHRRAAESLEADSDPRHLSKLWRAAGELEKSIACALSAADRERRAERPAEAAVWLRFALTGMHRRDPRRVDVRRRQAHALAESSQYPEAVRALGTVLRSTRDPRGRSRVLADRAIALAFSGRQRLGIVVAKQAEELATSVRVLDTAAQARRARGMCLYRDGEFEAAIPLLTASAEDLNAAGEGTASAAAIYLAGVCASRLRRFADARGMLNTALVRASENHDHGRVANGFIALGNLELRSWNLEQSLVYYEEARRVIESHDLQSHRLGLGINHAQALLDSGRFDAAMSLVDEIEPLALHLGSRDWLSFARLVRGGALHQVGRPSEASEEFSRAIDVMDSEMEPTKGDFVRLSLAEALLETPNADGERIRSLISGVLQKPQPETKALFGALVLEMERRLDREPEALIDSVRDRFEELARKSPESLEPPLRVRAELAHCRQLQHSGRTEECAAVAGAAAQEADGKGLPALAARLRAVEAEALDGLGRRDEARRSIERAQASLEEAASRIGDETMRRDFLERPVFRGIRRSRLAAAAVTEERLFAIYEMIRVLNSETDPDLLLESMLDMALQVVQAERGMILLRENRDEEFVVRLARNLEKETIADAAEFSRNVVLTAGTGQSVLAIDTSKDERLNQLKSVSLFGIRSVLCVPLRSRERVIGAVYLDNRDQGTMFTPEDLRFLEAFADHAALALENAQTRHRLEQENQRLQVAAESRIRFENMIGGSPPMQRVYDLVTKVAESGLPALVLGESGTGKELVARAIHARGPRKRKAFLTENCAAIPESLLESELFGHVRGAFTGADRDRVGLFEQADGGTLFLDEVGDMSPAMQARLLRVLQEGELRRVGGEARLKVDVRLIAATHRDLSADVASGRFREDLFYRLQVLIIQLPPLRERPGDIPLLVDHFLKQISRGRGRAAPKMRADVLALFERYRWPGNVRQLENHLQRLALLAGDGPITTEVVRSDPGLREALLRDDARATPVYSLAHNEREQIEQALVATGGNRTRAAKLLGISRATIFRKIKEYGLP